MLIQDEKEEIRRQDPSLYRVRDSKHNMRMRTQVNLCATNPDRATQLERALAW